MGIERAFCAGGDLAALVRSLEVEQQGRGRTLVSGRRAAGSGPAASGRFMPLASFCLGSRSKLLTAMATARPA